MFSVSEVQSLVRSLGGVVSQALLSLVLTSFSGRCSADGAVALCVIHLATLVGRGRFSDLTVPTWIAYPPSPPKATRGGGTCLLVRSGSDVYSGAKEIGSAPVQEHGLIAEEDSLWVRKNDTDSHSSQGGGGEAGSPAGCAAHSPDTHRRELVSDATG